MRTKFSVVTPTESSGCRVESEQTWKLRVMSDSLGRQAKNSALLWLSSARKRTTHGEEIDSSFSLRPLSKFVSPLAQLKLVTGILYRRGSR